MAAAESARVAAVVCASRSQMSVNCAPGIGRDTARSGFLRKPNKIRVSVVACSNSRYSASPLACCRRIHFSGTISGWRPICFFWQWVFSSGNGAYRVKFLRFLHLRSSAPLGELAVFGADIAPFVGAPNFWLIAWINLLLESLLKFFVIGEICSRVFSRYSSISRVGRVLVSGFGGVLVLVAGLFAGFAHGDNPRFLISGVHLLEQTVFIIETGLIFFLFLLAAYFHLSWDRLSFGCLDRV